MIAGNIFKRWKINCFSNGKAIIYYQLSALIFSNVEDKSQIYKRDFLILLFKKFKIVFVKFKNMAWVFVIHYDSAVNGGQFLVPFLLRMQNIRRHGCL